MLVVLNVQLALIKAAGVNRVWSTDCIAHASNAISMAPLLAQALKPLLKQQSGSVQLAGFDAQQAVQWAKIK